MLTIKIIRYLLPKNLHIGRAPGKPLGLLANENAGLIFHLSYIFSSLSTEGASTRAEFAFSGGPRGRARAVPGSKLADENLAWQNFSQAHFGPRLQAGL